jgi:photosystem II stability/assembly factor-like uncharacterized protein
MSEESMSENTLPEELQTDYVYDLVCTEDMSACFAARSAGLYHSADGGESWAFLYDSLDAAGPLVTTSVVIPPHYDGDVERSIFAGVPGGVLRSADGGETWFATILDSPPPAVSAMVISPNYAEDGVLLAATTEDGIFRSATRGSHWARWNFGLLDLNVFSLAISPGFAEDETLFAGVESGIFRSTNGGRAWREVDLSIGFEPVISMALSPTYPEDGIIFAGTETQGLIRSEDKGESWTRLGADVITDPVNAVLLSQNYRDQPDVLVLLENELWFSRDGGASWQLLDHGLSSMTAVHAPQGLVEGAPLLIGLAGGTVERVRLDLT